MEDLGTERVHGRPIRLFQLSDWSWDWSWHPRIEPFVLFVAADAVPDDEVEIRRFAADAIEAGCGYVVAWGDGCERVHDLFDQASIEAERFVMSTWHSAETLPVALYFALVTAFPDEEEFPDAGESAVVLAVQEEWIAEVRHLVSDQDALATLWTADGE